MALDWYAERIQLALFVGPTWSRRPLFNQLTGTEPQDVSERGQAQMRQEAGHYGPAFLSVLQRPGRIDIALSDNPSTNVNNPTAPDYKRFFWIDKVQPAIKLFDSIVSRLPEFKSPLVRIGYVVAIIYPTNDAMSSIAALRDALPLVSFDPQNDTDISWQVNRPRMIEGVGTINRLSRWNPLNAGFVQIAVEGPMPPILPILTPADPTEFAARGELDINTSASNPEIDADKVHGVIELLRSIALDIIQNGERP